MKALPIRVWLGLLLVLLVAIPAITTVALVLTRPPRPPDDRVPGTISLDPRIETMVTSNTGRWADPAWQQALQRELDTEGQAIALFDASGQVIYRSPALASPDRATAPLASPAARVAASLEIPTADGVALAMIRETGPLPARTQPVIRTDQLVPLSQLAVLVLIALAIGVFVYRAFLRPLNALIAAMQRVGNGDLDAELPPSRVSEMNAVTTAFMAMAEALRGSLERQEELEQERRMTISAVIHDLRTPLFSLRGYLEGLASGLASTPEKQARYLQICQDKANALERLVNDLFAYTRTEYLEEAPRTEPLDLTRLLTGLVEGLAPQAREKEVEMVLSGPPGPVWIAGDAHLLNRAIDNVLDNAIRHTPNGGEIRISWRTGGGMARFTIADSGPGIPPEDMAHVFTPLFRGESSRNRRTGGAGLGLPIARRLLRAHHGELTVANGSRGGAEFTGSVPLLSMV